MLSLLLLSGALQTPAKPTLYYIPHTHWEGAVFNTREEYLDFGLDHILEALRLMERFPEYKFALDQVAYFKPLLERYPEQAAKFRKFVKEGRLEIVGGMDVMPDDVKLGGELFIRQMTYGKAYCRKELGLDVDVAWMLDTFGHQPQLPQLLKQAGYKSFWFCRGVPSDNEPSEFNLKGLDGTTIPTFWLPGFYGLFYGPPRDQKGFDKFFVDRFNSLNPNARGNERVGLAGVDVSEPEDYVTPLLREFNAKQDAPFNIRYSVPSEFAKLVSHRSNVPTESYDLNPIFPGTYSSRVELRQRAKTLETKLLNAEQLGALAGVTDDSDIWRAWEPVLFNQTHDLASGTMNDHVYVDTVRSYDFADRLADEAIDTRRRALLAKIDTSGEGIPVVVFNPLGSERTDAVNVELGFADTGVNSVRVVDADGGPAACQVTWAETYSDGALKRAKLTFVAKGIPACGYATLRVLPSAEALPGATPGGDRPTLENEFYRVTVDPKTGAITSVFDKQVGAEMLSASGNVVARKVDKGDLWSLYKWLDGAEHPPNRELQPVPDRSTAVLSSDFSDKAGQIVRGPAFEEFNVSHPFGSGKFATRIRLTRGVKRIDIETELVNAEKHVRYQVLFPTAIKNGTYVQEVPFGAIERPAQIEYPAQNWADCSDGKQGFALLNCAMPGNVLSDGTLMLSLMRSVNLGDYNGGDTSDTGFELNVPRTFRYALAPHAGGWRDAMLAQAGQELNSPLLAFKAESHPGPMPKRWGLLKTDAANVVVTSVKSGPDGSIAVRLYEACGLATPAVKLTVGGRVASA